MPRTREETEKHLYDLIHDLGYAVMSLKMRQDVEEAQRWYQNFTTFLESGPTSSEK